MAALMLSPQLSFAVADGDRGMAQGAALDLKRERSQLPTAGTLAPLTTNKQGSGAAVKPPKSNEFLEINAKEAEYEHLVDEEIRALYGLLKQNSRSKTRGEIWLRLGEQFVEKSRIVDQREQADYERKLQDYLAQKTTVKPRLDQKRSREFNNKAVQLYEWFVRDFPRDPKVDQALFFLGYNNFELGNAKNGERYYLELVTRYPNSPYVTESHFALGEYYFENEDWKHALDNYLKVIAAKRARLYSFALYKSAWCNFRLGQTQEALRSMERVIRLSKAAEREEQLSGRHAVNKVRLANEALKDYVPFFAEGGQPTQAAAEFDRLTGGDRAQTQPMLEKLAYIYADSGNRAAAALLFRQLISMNPTSERAAEYEHQLVLMLVTGEPRLLRAEIETWLTLFGPKSDWARANAANAQLTSDTAKLQESTVRTYVLQLHQAAQNSRAEYSQRTASSAYAIYFKYFAETPFTIQMHFFHAELLFDMARYEDAAKEYGWVAENDSKGIYRDKAILNALLSLEKDLPDPKEIDKKRGQSLAELPLDPPVERFEKGALAYLKLNPKSEKATDIQRRLAVLYYSYNHFDQAIELFEKIIRASPKSQNGIIAGNLLLDIYKLRNDMIGFTDKGKELLANPEIASTEFGRQVRTMLEKAGYLRAEKIDQSGDHLRAAKEFEAFAASYRQSDLAAAARYKAASSYEQAGDPVSAVRMFNLLLATTIADPKIRTLQSDSRNNLAKLYQQMGQLEQAAKAYYDYASAASASNAAASAATSANASVNGFYNAALLWEALGDNASAMRAYSLYFDRTKSADRIEILFTQAELLRRTGDLSHAATYYDRYFAAGARDTAHVVQSAFELGRIAQRQNHWPQAARWYRKTLELHAQSSKKDATVIFAAEARFQLAQEIYDKILEIKFTTNDRQQGQAAKDILRLKDRYIAEMKEVIRFDNAPFIVAAIGSSGKLFDSIADIFSRIPAPRGFSAEDAAKYKALIQDQVNGLRKEAQASYQSTIDKSRELETFTDWTKYAYSALVNKPKDSEFTADDSKALDWMGL